MSSMAHEPQHREFMRKRPHPALFLLVSCSVAVTLAVPWLPVACAAALTLALASAGKTSPGIVLYVALVAVAMGSLRHLFGTSGMLWFIGAEGGLTRMVAANTLSFIGAFVLTLPVAFAVAFAEGRVAREPLPALGPYG